MADGERRGIHKISVASGETRQITRAIGHEFAPLLSPDGRALVFMRQEGPAPASIEHVLRQNLAADGSPEGAPQVLFEGRSMSSGLAWTSSGKELVFCTSDSAFYGPFNSRLYRMRADGRYPLVPLGLSGCSTVATSRPDASGHVMMVYASGDNTKGRLWQAGLDALDRAAPLAPSSRFDGLPSYSPDGSFVAFVSNRSGSPEVWVARRDGTGTKKVTENSHVSSIPRWSPDGARLVYGAAAPPDQAAAGSALYGLYIAPIAGAAPSRVHLGVQSASDPSWSPDGQWIYYWSGSQIWRTRPDGTGSNLVGEHPAHFVRPGILEGGRMYYTRSGQPFALCRASVETGKEELLVDALATPFFSVTRKFVYFIKLTDRNLYALPVFGGPERRLGRLPESEGIGRIILGISVSPDDASIVWAITNGQQLDLQLVRDFR